MNLLATNAVSNGRTATNLVAAEATPGAGTYYLIVEDQMDAGSDPAHPYSLTVRPFAEPDGNDKPTRNDTTANATALGAFACGGGVSFGKTAYLASRADVDWYKVTLSGVGRPARRSSTSLRTGAAAARPCARRWSWSTRTPPPPA